MKRQETHVRTNGRKNCVRDEASEWKGRGKDAWADLRNERARRKRHVPCEKRKPRNGEKMRTSLARGRDVEGKTTLRSDGVAEEERVG